MTTESHPDAHRLEALAADLVAAYVSKNAVPQAELPQLIASVHTTLNLLAVGASSSVVEERVAKPSAAQIRDSITQDGIVSFIDGRTYKTMKRHLTAHGLTPATYYERYGLPPAYPMVAASYSARRSSLAKAIGLGNPGRRAKRGKTDMNS